MKIGIVCYPTYGGSGVVATELGKALAKKDHQVHFITYKPPARLNIFDANLHYHEVRFANYPLFQYPPYETALASTMVDVIKNERLDVLHVHYAIPHASAAYMAQQILKAQNIDIPFITTLHGTDITLVGKDETFAPVVEFSINQSNAVTTVSESLRQDTLSHFNITNDIKVIPNFVDIDRFVKTDLDHFKKMVAPNGEKVLVHVSNFRKVKRADDVVRIFAKVQAEIPAKLLLIGDGPERSKVENICRKLSCCNNIRFLGKQSKIEELLSVSDLFLMPSESESFGLAALEAMACEVPVLSSNAGGIPEINLHGKTGLLYNVGDVDGMAKGALQILQDTEKFQDYRTAALNQAKAYAIEKILPQYEALYYSMVPSLKTA